MKGNKQIAFLLLSLLLAAMAGCGNNAGGGATSTLAASESCIGCHANATSPGTGANIVTEWKASVHNTEAAANKTGLGSGCRDCHEPAAGHPNSCGKCHGGVTPGALPSQDVVTNPDQDQICFNCHGLAHPNDVMLQKAPQHFINISTNVQYPASYVSSQNVGHCRNCHNPHDPSTNIAINKDAALLDGHSNPTGSWSVKSTPPTGPKSDDFKTRGSALPAATSLGDMCVRCHTTTGYINFVTSGFSDIKPWGGSTDLTRQVLGCNACHDNGQGKAYSFKLRSVPPFTAYYNFSSAMTIPTIRLNNIPVNYPDVGPSNLCVPCHTGRGGGQTIKDVELLPVMNNITSIGRFGTGHNYMAAAIMFKKAGYEYPGRVYDNPPTYAHDKIGMNNFNGTGTSGPCVTCHMTPNRHSYKAVLQKYSSSQLLQHVVKPAAIITSTISDNGIISTACAHCHNDSFMPAWTPAKLQAQKAGFYAATEVLKEMLKIKAPITGTRYWQRLYGPGTRPNTMGAALNSYQFGVEPGAYVHNGVYTKRLIYDSIDWLDNGVLDNDVEAAINTLKFTNSKNLSNVFYNTTSATAVKAAAISYLIGGNRP